MKYAFIALLALPFLGASHAAAASCGDPSLNRPASETVTASIDPVTGDTMYATTTIQAISNVYCDGTNPENVASAWGTNTSVPKVQPGGIVSDEWGFSYICPAWYGHPCVDITHTSYYRVMMQPILKLYGLIK